MITVDCSGRFPAALREEDAVKLVRRALKLAAVGPAEKAGGGIGSAAVSLSLVDDDEIRRLNRHFRGRNQATDVLSFGYPRSRPAVAAGRGRRLERQLGDIVVSLETARRSAKLNRRSLKEELALLIVHGCLHLIGYDHCTQAQESRMFRLQQDILAGVGIL